MEPEVGERTPRNNFIGKKYGEKSNENRRSSADTWDSKLISKLYRNSLNITGMQEFSKPQNPVLVLKEKGNYQSLKNRNKVSTFLKIGLPSTCHIQVVEFKSSDTKREVNNVIYTGISPPQIVSDPNASAGRRNLIEHLDDSNVRPLNQESTNFDEQTNLDNKNEQFSAVDQERRFQTYKLPVIQRATKKQNNRAYFREVLIPATSRPSMHICYRFAKISSAAFDTDSTNKTKWTNESSSPLVFNGNLMLSSFQVGTKASYQSQRKNTNKICAHKSFRDSVPESGTINDSRICNFRGRERNSTEFPAGKEVISYSAKAQNVEQALVFINGRNNIISHQVHQLSKETAQLDDHVDEDLILRNTPQKELNARRPLNTKKNGSPVQNRKTYHSVNEIKENMSVINKPNQSYGFRTENEQPILTSALISEKIFEGRIPGNHFRHKNNNLSLNSNAQVFSEMHQNISPRISWSRENTDRGLEFYTRIPQSISQEPKKTYSKITAIAKTNDKTAIRASLQSEKGAYDNQKYLIYLDYLYKVSFAFGVVCRPPLPQTTYKYFIGKGNNGLMVRSLLKTRWWWTPVDDIESGEVHLVWTQLRNNNIIESLKSKRKSFEPGIEGMSCGKSIDYASLSQPESDNYTLKASSHKNKSERSSSNRKTSENDKQKDEACHLDKLLTKFECVAYKDFLTTSKKKLLDPDGAELLVKSFKGDHFSSFNPTQIKMHNRMECNYHLSNKKKLYYNMKSYYEMIKDNVFNYLPLTFHIRNGTQDEEYNRFLEYFNEREKSSKEFEKQYDEADQVGKKELAHKKIRNIWIIKPGENTNRGQGIRVVSELSEIQQLINSNEKHPNGSEKTYIIQQYLDRPLLYNKRKFDIRCYMMITSVNGHMKGYWYQDGYIRTCSKEFTLKNLENRLIHLTNDAVQKKGEEYGKFENGNKISYTEFQRYIDTVLPEAKVNFFTEIYPQMRNMARDSIRAVYGKIDPNRREHTFEVFGLDFMIDQSFKPWLIEINTNPCLELSAPLLARLIPSMLENAFRIAVDPFFPPPIPTGSKKNLLPGSLIENNKFELIFDEAEDGSWLRTLGSVNNEAATGQIFDIQEDEMELENEADEEL